MKLLLGGIAFALLGLIAGAGFNFYRLQSGAASTDIFPKNGAWHYAADMDLAKDKLQRALIARSGLFALRESEVLYYFLREDEAGNPLSSKHIYELRGNNFDSRYWSFTLYGSDDFLIPNEEKRFTLNQENVVFEDSLKQSYTFYLSQTSYGENWIPSGKAENMTLLLRLYNPSPEIYNSVGSYPLPQIRKVK